MSSLLTLLGVSTHSRPKAAALVFGNAYLEKVVSTHSRPKAAADMMAGGISQMKHVSTHSRPKAAAPYIKK